MNFQDAADSAVRSEFVVRVAGTGSGGPGRSIGHQQTLMALHSLSIPEACTAGDISWHSMLKAVGALL